MAVASAVITLEDKKKQISEALNTASKLFQDPIGREFFMKFLRKESNEDTAYFVIKMQGLSDRYGYDKVLENAGQTEVVPLETTDEGLLEQLIEVYNTSIYEKGEKPENLPASIRDICAKYYEKVLCNTQKLDIKSQTESSTLQKTKIQRHNEMEAIFYAELTADEKKYLSGYTPFGKVLSEVLTCLNDDTVNRFLVSKQHEEMIDCHLWHFKSQPLERTIQTLIERMDAPIKQEPTGHSHGHQVQKRIYNSYVPLKNMLTLLKTGFYDDKGRKSLHTKLETLIKYLEEDRAAGTQLNAQKDIMLQLITEINAFKELLSVKAAKPVSATSDKPKLHPAMKHESSSSHGVLTGTWRLMRRHTHSTLHQNHDGTPLNSPPSPIQHALGLAMDFGGSPAVSSPILFSTMPALTGSSTRTRARSLHDLSIAVAGLYGYNNTSNTSSPSVLSSNAPSSASSKSMHSDDSSIHSSDDDDTREDNDAMNNSIPSGLGL